MSTPEPEISIAGKTILITGGTGLIGREIVTCFLEQGAQVVVGDIVDSALETFGNELKTKFNEADFLIFKCDITNENDAGNIVEATVKKFGKLDVLINNAAIDAKFDQTGTDSVDSSRFENYPISLLRKSVEVNLNGTVIMTQAACRQMLKQGYGNIINVASTYSMVAPNQALYDFGDGEPIRYKPVDYIASKSFVPNFTRYIATYYAKEKIRCNAIVPHAIFNNHGEKFTNNFSKFSPLGRMSDRSELRGPFLLLASESSSYMTGSVLTVDGGWTAW